MAFLTFLSQAIIPLMIVYIVGYGLLKKTNIFDAFVTGAFDGIKTVAKLLPTLIGLLVAVGCIRYSGLLDFLGEKLGAVFNFFGFPIELFPLALIKSFSASAANALVFDIFKTHGCDSFLGMAASIMMSCTETLLYCVSVYFAATKVTKTRWTITGGLLASLIGIFSSILLALLLT